MPSALFIVLYLLAGVCQVMVVALVRMVMMMILRKMARMVTYGDL